MSAALNLQPADWFSLFTHFLSLSLLAVGGAITTAPEMHRYLVDERHWLTDPQFSASIAIAQAAPGPNILFVALMGWNVGLNSHGAASGLFAVLITMLGMLLPSTMLTYLASQWGHRNRGLRAVRAFKQGMAPIVIALLVATGWILAAANGSDLSKHWPLWLLTIVAAMVVWWTKTHLLWLLAAGALLGWFGLV